MKQTNFSDLLTKFKNQQCSPEELCLIEQWYQSWEVEVPVVSESDLFKVKNAVWKQLTKELHPKKKFPFRRAIRLITAIAIMLFAISICLLLMLGLRSVMLM